MCNVHVQCACVNVHVHVNVNVKDSGFDYYYYYYYYDVGCCGCIIFNGAFAKFPSQSNWIALELSVE